MDWCLYRYRHLVENAFALLKQYRAIATWYDNLARNYATSLAITCCMRWVKLIFGWNLYSKDQHALIFRDTLLNLSL